MSDFTDIMSELSFKLPGSSLGAQTLEVKNTLREFCGRTNAWVIPVAFTTTPGVLSYDLVVREGNANRLMNVTDTNGNVPVGAGFAMPCTVILNVNNGTALNLVANIAVNPDVLDENVEISVPDWFWSQYHNPLIDGVLGKMMSHVSKPYSNPSMAKFHVGMFQSAMNGIRTEVLRRYTFRAQGWAFPTGGFIGTGRRR